MERRAQFRGKHFHAHTRREAGDRSAPSRRRRYIVLPLHSLLSGCDPAPHAAAISASDVLAAGRLLPPRPRGRRPGAAEREEEERTYQQRRSSSEAPAHPPPRLEMGLLSVEENVAARNTAPRCPTPTAPFARCRDRVDCAVPPIGHLQAHPRPLELVSNPARAGSHFPQLRRCGCPRDPHRMLPPLGQAPSLVVRVKIPRPGSPASSPGEAHEHCEKKPARIGPILQVQNWASWGGPVIFPDGGGNKLWDQFGRAEGA